MGGAPSYYEKLYGLGKKIFVPYLKALRDVAFNDQIKARFEDLEGFSVSYGSQKRKRAA